MTGLVCIILYNIQRVLGVWARIYVLSDIHKVQCIC